MSTYVIYRIELFPVNLSSPLISTVLPRYLHFLNLTDFLHDFISLLSFAATIRHEFMITGDFNIHRGNPTDHLTSQFLSICFSFNLTQHVNFPTHNKNHILDLVITSSDCSLARSLSSSHCSPCDHFPVLTRLSTRAQQ